jgi:hypothetical protein
LDVLGPVRYDVRLSTYLREHLATEGQRLETEIESLVSLVRESGAKRKEMPLDAAVYICWYSQLRELISRAADENRDLATKLRICALPSGGFTGDWYIGVVNGSVSLSLGQALVETLCRKKEAYKRFVRGVGLPTEKEFYSDKFFAWPGSGVSLSTLGKILEGAGSRAKINGYQDIKTVLYWAWRDLWTGVPARKILDGLEARVKALEA